MLSIFNSKQVATPIQIETKAAPTRSLTDLLRSNSEWSYLSAFQALRYYSSVSAIATAVDLVADSFSALSPVVYDKNKLSYDTDNDMIRFLSRPSMFQSGPDFFRSLSSFYIITGNVFVLSTGVPTRAPVELSVISPATVSVEIDTDGLVKKYTVRNGNTDTVFTRKDTGKRVRYFNGTDRELYHIKDFSAQGNTNGASKLDAIYYSIEQLIKSDIHNLSLLKKGARPSGAIKIPAGMSDPDFTRLKDELASKIQGAENTGSILALVDGLEWLELGTNNKDLDFLNLKTEVKESIYVRLGIPLPLVSTATMSYSNYSEARVALYDQAVLPLMNKLYRELFTFLGDRFKLNDNQELTVDQSTVPALADRRLSMLEKQAKLNVLSDNEIRGSLGYESIGKEGDIIRKPINMVEVGDDDDTTSNRSSASGRK